MVDFKKLTLIGEYFSDHQHSSQYDSDDSDNSDDSNVRRHETNGGFHAKSI